MKSYLKLERKPVTFSLIFESKSKDILDLYLKILEKNVGHKSLSFNLPTLIKKITLLRSPFIYKKSKTHYEVRTYRACYKFNNQGDLHRLLNIIISNKPKSVSIKVKYSS